MADDHSTNDARIWVAYRHEDGGGMAAIRNEMDRARELHQWGFEAGNDDEKFRILGEEVGEVARAIDDLATLARVNRNTLTTAQIDELRSKRVAARKHLLEEVVQVAATAARWAANLEPGPGLAAVSDDHGGEQPCSGSLVHDELTPCPKCDR
jgi:hypothetical protein